MTLREPRIHSHITDCLPDDHPLAYSGVACRTCLALLHAANNECMQTWVETGRGTYCLACFVCEVGGLECTKVLDDEWGLA
jgi:hypothetical protein